MIERCTDKHLDELLRQLSQENWDSYGARPLDPRAVEAVRRFRDRYLNCGNLPNVVPCVNGGL